jgi:hypothetical protein
MRCGRLWGKWTGRSIVTRLSVMSFMRRLPVKRMNEFKLNKGWQDTCGGLARTVYIHRIRPYIWWFPCQKYRIYTVYIWFWPTLYLLPHGSGGLPAALKHTSASGTCLHNRLDYSQVGAEYTLETAENSLTPPWRMPPTESHICLWLRYFSRIDTKPLLKSWVYLHLHHRT